MGNKNIHDALGDIVGMGLSPTVKKDKKEKKSPPSEPTTETSKVEPDPNTEAIAPKKTKKKKIPKRDSPHHTKTFLHLPNDIYERLGVAAAKIRGKDKSDITAEALAEWLDRQGL